MQLYFADIAPKFTDLICKLAALEILQKVKKNSPLFCPRKCSDTTCYRTNPEIL